MQGSILLKKMGIGCVVGLILAFVVSMFAPRIYEGRTELLLMGDDPKQKTNVLGEALETQLALLRSEGVYKEAYRAALRKKAHDTRDAQPKQPSLALYHMYAVDADDKSGAATVRVQAYEPQFAAELANQIGMIYRVTRAKAVEQADKAQKMSLITRSEKAKQDLDAAESNLTAYKEQTGSPDLNMTTQQTLTYEANLTSRLNDARSELQQAMRAKNTYQGGLKLLPRTIKSIEARAPDAEFTTLQNSLSELQRQRVEALRTYVETSSKVRAIDAQIQAVQSKLAEANKKPWQTQNYTEIANPEVARLVQQLSDANAHISALNAEISNLSSTLAKVQKEVARLPSAQKEMQRLQRTYDFALSKYSSLQQQVAEKMTEAGTTTASVTTMEATADPNPVSPNVPFLLMLGGGLGLIGGAIFAMATRKEITSVRTADDLERLTGLAPSAVLGLPRRQEDKQLKALPSAQAKPAEAYRFMALTMPPGEGAKRIMFTGVGSDAGCSSAAGQFALALACEGRPTLLIDCDFRQSSLTHVFNSGQKPGLSDILRKTLLPSQDDHVHMATQHENLLFLPSGSSGDGSIADFSHSQLRAAIEMLTERADILVLDTPPCDVVTDAVRLCPLVDIVYLVVSAEDTESSKVNMAHRMLQRCGAKEVHVMLTGSDPNSAPFSAA